MQMVYFLPATLVFLGQCYLLFSWLSAYQQKDSRAKTICFWGFLLGQAYLIWEVFLVKQTGKPAPDSPEQRLLMARILLGGSLGGLFTLIGLFYLSFATSGHNQTAGSNRSIDETTHH